jgi:hypothetical protein
MVLGRLKPREDASAYERSFGLCQPHVRSAVSLAPSPEVRMVLLEVQQRQLRRRVESLRASEADRSRRSGAARALAAKLAGSRRSG